MKVTLEFNINTENIACDLYCDVNEVLASSIHNYCIDYHGIDIEDKEETMIKLEIDVLRELSKKCLDQARLLEKELTSN